MVKTKNAVKPVEIVMEKDNTIDVTLIEDPVVRAMVQQLIDESEAKELELKKSLEQMKIELERERALRELKLPPTQEWTVHVQNVLADINAANAVPLTVRQKAILGKGIRMIARELSGVYTINKRNPKELELMKAAATKLGAVVMEFGVPEETDPTYQGITAKKKAKQ